MPKAYITKKATDVTYLRSAYRKLIKFILFFYLITGAVLTQIFIYNFYLTKNDYFVVTTFGKLIEIKPKDNSN